MAPKRKRSAAPAAVDPAPKPEPILQPSSRDASEEDIEDPVLHEVSSLKQKQQGAENGPSHLATTSNSNSNSKKHTTKLSSLSMGAPSAVHQSVEAVNDALGMKFPPPPRAGEIEPAGYHTNPPPVGRPVRVYADGVFDLFHMGHMRVLEQAKRAFPNTHLTVGVTGDDETHKRKGLTVLTARERAESVRHCRWVDAVIEDCPWILTPEFMAEHGFDYVAHDDIPYGAAEGDDIYAAIKQEGKFLVTQRTEGVSTTGIITKIVRDYEQYISRQLKRGTSRQELNISWLKKNELDLKRHVAELRDSIRSNWTSTGQEVRRELRAFFPLSRPASPARSSITLTPRAPSGARSPSSELRHNERDFAAGYSLGLVGGVRSWMLRNRRNIRSGNSAVGADTGASQPVSPVGTSPLHSGTEDEAEREETADADGEVKSEVDDEEDADSDEEARGARDAAGPAKRQKRAAAPNAKAAKASASASSLRQALSREDIDLDDAAASPLGGGGGARSRKRRRP